jgi:CubicO group peptidase (beta-lactamase class C family)
VENAGFSTERLARISTFIESEITAKKIPGAVLAIERHGLAILRKAWGLRDAGTRSAMTLDSIFRIYSMTKPIVSIAAMMLAEEGLLRLDKPVADFIPSFGNLNVGRSASGEVEVVAPKQAMNVHDLLRHTSGLTYGFLGDGFVRRLYRDKGLVRGDFTNEEFCERLSKLPLMYEPATVWEYSHATDVLGRIIEIVSGRSLFAFLKERLFEPLGMEDTSFFVADSAQHGRIAEAFAHDANFGPGTGLGNPRKPRQFESGGGGLVSTLDDYRQFARMLLAGGTLDGKTFVSRKTLAFMTADHIGPSTLIAKTQDYLPGSGFGFGLGFAVRLETGAAPYPGSIDEFNWSGVAGTYFWIDPKEDMFVILMMQAPAQRLKFQAALKSLIYGALV